MNRVINNQVNKMKDVPVSIPANVCQKVWLYVRIRAQATSGTMTRIGAKDQPKAATKNTESPEIAVVCPLIFQYIFTKYSSVDCITPMIPKAINKNGA